MQVTMSSLASFGLVLIIGLGARSAAGQSAERGSAAADSLSSAGPVASSPQKRGSWQSRVRLSAGQITLDMNGVEPMIAGHDVHAASHAVTFGPQLTWSAGRLSLELAGQMLVPGTRRGGDLALRTSGGLGI